MEDNKQEIKQESQEKKEQQEQKSNIDKFWDFLGMIMRAVLNFFLKPFHKELSEEVYNALLQFVKFGVVGVSNTIISYVLYAGSLYLLQKNEILVNYNHYVAQVIAFVLSVLWSFYWNNKMVFTVQDGQKRSMWKALLKTYVSYSFTGLFLNTILLFLWVDILGISAYIAPVFNLIIGVPINFLINKFWAFKTKEK